MMIFNFIEKNYAIFKFLDGAKTIETIEHIEL